MEKTIIRPQVVIGLLLSMTLALNVACTSSDEPESALEAELGDLDMGGEGLADDMSDMTEDPGVGEFAELDESFGDLSEELGDDLTDELDGEFAGESEFAELDDSFDDADFSEEEGEFASNEDEFNEFDDDFSDFPEDNQFAQNEQSLEDELNQSAGMPVVENAQPVFPEEVVGQNQMDPAFAPLPLEPAIQSESRDIVAIDPLEVEPLPQDDLGQPDPLVAQEEEADAQSWVPVVKIKTDPFFRNSRLMNAVYIARPKDDFVSVSQKLFGSDRVEELKSDNPHLAKGIDPGDKVYYSSPNRPSDQTIVKVYYDDIGLRPQYYTTQGGDNMRRLGLKLLGFPEGWKEIWAINQQVDSKTILPGGVEIKYWTGEESRVELPIAANEPPPASTPPVTEDVAAMGTMEDPFAGGMEDPVLPAEPPLPEAGFAMAENAPPPEIIPDVAPFPEQVIEPQVQPVVVSSNQEDSLLSVGALALLLIAGVALVAIQIKKRKEATMVAPRGFEYTQV